MPGLDPGIHAVAAQHMDRQLEWIAEEFKPGNDELLMP